MDDCGRYCNNQEERRLYDMALNDLFDGVIYAPNRNEIHYEWIALKIVRKGIL